MLMAISNLPELIRKMKPVLAEGKYYFATVEESQLPGLSGYLEQIDAIMREKEGLTVIFKEAILQEAKGLTDEKIIGPFAKITLSANSDLLAVGFLAKITAALAKEGVSANALSAYHHDHLFVPYENRAKALVALKKLAQILG